MGPQRPAALFRLRRLALILPSFGAYTGGLDVGEEAIAGLFGGRFHAYMLGSERVYAIPREQGARTVRLAV